MRVGKLHQMAVESALKIILESHLALQTASGWLEAVATGSKGTALPAYYDLLVDRSNVLRKQAIELLTLTYRPIYDALNGPEPAMSRRPDGEALCRIVEDRAADFEPRTVLVNRRDIELTIRTYRKCVDDPEAYALIDRLQKVLDES